MLMPFKVLGSILQSISKLRLAMRSLLVIVLFVCSTPSWCDEVLIGRVVRIVDGDTLLMLDSKNAQHRVRLSGIDAPESKQPFGKVSRQNLADLVFQKQVKIETGNKDRYGRLIGKIWVESEDCSGCGMTLDANLAQVTAGLAWWYRDYAYEQSVEDRGLYESAEHEAKAKQVGLWGDTEPHAPWDWRSGSVIAADAPEGCPIKGNINSDGVHIYHAPGRRSYAATRIDLLKGERWFCSVVEAVEAGWRAAR
jgi:endonuclease YncB( thermonuclease family)